MRRVFWQKRIRKWHRYLGLVFGIQFLLWTIGGLYFSWSNIKTVRGDDIRVDEAMPGSKLQYASPSIAISQLMIQHPHAVLGHLQLMVNSEGEPIYLISYHEHHEEHHLVADAISGKVLPVVAQDTAVSIALRSVKGRYQPVAVKLLTATDGHHEYREKPLPAYAVTLTGDTNATVYVGQETGMVHSVRNNQWRVFDFLWMLHIMDFKTRDNINNWVLRVLSVAGLITLCSGYALFFLSRRRRLIANSN